ncbi:MAG: 1-deoxy-D-xylulose-5-phosphate synthase [Bacteroidetes bacterium]|nr:1-deoxy-D-xylulose-5-phosphate synthase [Bacteroidota bacterium]MBU1579251.1 1-deoxy-D-xylulose-5-phosphate synthase [Bacteroidota bacterium]MBU2465035.1 1-deoxy-D-xylulose-5-phosphate synthase [Bacteroidota bacterium]MBU2558413.1 1-deoxy-D-xylulose-5-phosphate synthase [Bacteroidota bacterium]
MALQLLSKINDPADLRKLQPDSFPDLAEELRSFILDVTAVNPGHLGASLGVIELSIALHYLFDTPNDRLIWDVGHQAYAHKILTGRKELFQSLRKLDGISGFPSRSESDYDAFGTGHASTALSAAVGMAVAAGLQGNHSRHHIAVIGDGAITGGMFFEALNQAGAADLNLIIILNDNGIAIDKSAGALKDYLIRQAEKHSSQAFSNPLFEAFGIACNGPVDGHNFAELLPALEAVKAMKGVRLLHVITTKGKGFERAEKDQVRYHAPGTFDRLTGELPKAKPVENRIPLYQEVFGETLLELAKKYPELVGVTPAMPTGSHLLPLLETFPERCFDVGIAEQHALTFSAGLAAEGMLPFCVVYSTFLQRAYDQLIHDVALQNLPVVICVDRAGLVGEDGATHHGVFDLAYLRCIPNLVIAAPMDEKELRHLMFTAAANRKGPFVIRYPRGKTTAMDWKVEPEVVPIGKGRKLSSGSSIAVLSIGHPGNFVKEALEKLAAENIVVSHYDLRFLKPLDEILLKDAFEHHEQIITVEDGVRNGGMGSAVMEWAHENGFGNPVVRLGVPDAFISHGRPEELQYICGFDSNGIVKHIRKLLS